MARLVECWAVHVGTVGKEPRMDDQQERNNRPRATSLTMRLLIESVVLWGCLLDHN